MDLTRVRMPVFTLVTAAFVALKVVARYVVPEIPANFRLVMGISSGVYITGRRWPNQEDGGVKAVIRLPIDCFAMRKSASLRRRAGW